jgi:hypothetical protein
MRQATRAVMVSQAGEREVFPAFLYGNLVQIANR